MSFVYKLLCKRRSNWVPPCRSRLRGHRPRPELDLIRLKLRQGQSFLVSTLVAHGRRPGTRFLCPAGTQLLRRLEKKMHRREVRDDVAISLGNLPAPAPEDQAL